jgi:hypothetical protein
MAQSQAPALYQTSFNRAEPAAFGNLSNPTQEARHR